MIYRRPLRFSRGIRSGFLSYLNSHTLYFDPHFRAENAKCAFVFALVFSGQSSKPDNAAVATMLLPSVRFVQHRGQVFFRNATKNADNSGIFGIYTP